MFRVNEDGAEQKSIDGGSTWTNFSKGTVKELLWVNPSPTSAFAAQTISLDLSGYEECIVEFNQSISIQTMISRLLIKKEEILGGGYYSSSVSAYTNTRHISSFSNSGITFTNGRQGNSDNNNIIIPTKIYGLKKGVPSDSAVYYLGTGDSFDIKTILPDVDYKNLTADNFIVHITSGSCGRNTVHGNETVYISANASLSISKTYDNSTGVLSLINTIKLNVDGYDYGQWSTSGSCSAKVYLVLGEIKSLT